MFLVVNAIVFFKRNGNGFNIIPISLCLFWVFYSLMMLICSFNYNEIIKFLKSGLNSFIGIIIMFIHSIVLSVYISTVSYDYNCSETYQKCCIESDRNTKVSI